MTKRIYKVGHRNNYYAVDFYAGSKGQYGMVGNVAAGLKKHDAEIMANALNNEASGWAAQRAKSAKELHVRQRMKA